MFDQNQDPRFFKESPKTVNSFIRNSNEGAIKKFFMEDIDGLLEHYEPGRPHMKPDALKQIKEIEAKREQMLEEAIAEQKANGPIMLQRPGQEPLRLSSEQVVNIIKQQQEQVQALEEKNNQNTKYIGLLQQKLSELKKNPAEPNKQTATPEMSAQLNEYIAANQSLQERLIASVSEISSLKLEIVRLNEHIASYAAAAAAAQVAEAPENVILSLIAEQPAAEIVAKPKTSPEITVDMSDI
jgi:hypothetical protein